MPHAKTDLGAKATAGVRTPSNHGCVPQRSGSGARHPQPRRPPRGPIAPRGPPRGPPSARARHNGRRPDTFPSPSLPPAPRAAPELRTTSAQEFFFSLSRDEKREALEVVIEGSILDKLVAHRKGMPLLLPDAHPRYCYFEGGVLHWDSDNKLNEEPIKVCGRGTHPKARPGGGGGGRKARAPQKERRFSAPWQPGACLRGWVSGRWR